MAARRLIIAGFAGLLAACVHPAGIEGSRLSGNWGGSEASLSIDADGRGTIMMGCASAQVDGPITLDVGGHWLRSGSFTQGSGAPPPVPPTPVPAMVSGRLDADGTLWLSIATSNGQPLSNSKLYRDREPSFFICP